MIIAEEEYLEHHGVKGMKWGSRRNKRAQKRINVTKKAARGEKLSGKEKSLVGLRFFRKQKTTTVALKRLKSAQELKDKVSSGKGKTADILLKARGVNIRDLNYNVNE